VKLKPMKKKRETFTFKARIRSFRHAIHGIIDFFQTEHNALIHLFITVAVIGFGIWLSISSFEWIVIICMIGLVFMAELFNSAIEKLGDSITGEYNELIKKAKDYAAAGVIVAAITAAMVGLIIFIPVLIEKLKLIF
jgi:diacylglycerol kinase (ATP)